MNAKADISNFAHIFTSLGSDNKANINMVVQKTCEILDAACSLYNVLQNQGKSLETKSSENEPFTWSADQNPVGSICYDVTCQKRDTAVFYENVNKTKFKNTDPFIKKQKYKSYLGFPVNTNDKIFGSLCIYDKKPRKFTLAEIDIIQSFAKILSLIEEQQQLQENLKKAQKRFKDIFDSSDEAIFIYDAHTGALVDLNDGACRMFRCSQDELFKSDIIDFTSSIKPYTQRDGHILLKNAIKQGPQSMEWLAKRKDGESFWTHIDLKLSELSGEKKIIAVVKDINEQKKTENRLINSEKRFRVLSEATFEAVFLLDKSICFDANQAASKMFGYKLEELAGINIIDIIAPDSQEIVKHHISQGYDTSYQAMAIRKDGTTFPAEFYSKTFKYHTREVRVIGIRDISERKRAEQALEESRNMFRLVLDTIPVRVFWKDRDSLFLGCNLPLAHDAGVKNPAEIIGKSDYDLSWKAQAALYRSDDKQVIETGKSKIAYEEPQTIKDGQKRWLRTSKVALKNADDDIVGVLGTYEDITEHKNAEQAIRESEERLQLALQGANLGMWDWNLKTGEITFNDRWAEIVGYNLEEIEPCHNIYEKFAHPDDLEKILEKLENHLQGKTPYFETEHRLQHKTGKWIWVLDKGKVIERDEQNRPIRACGTHFDITKRKMAEEELVRTHDELLKQKNFLESLLSTIPNPVFYKDTKGRYMGCNEAFAEKLGMTQEEIRGKTVFDLWPTEYSMVYHEKDLELLQNPEKQIYEYKVRDVHGNESDVIFSKTVLRDTDGKVSGLIGVYTDITDRKRAEAALRENETKYRNLIENSTDAIYLMSNKKFEIINDQFQKLFNIKFQEIHHPDFDFFDLVAPKDKAKVQERMMRLEKGEKLIPEYEFTAITKDGHEKQIEASDSNFKLAEGYAIQGIFRDVTERKQLEEQAQHKQKLEAIGRLAGGIAHDFNNLLTVINGYCELLIYSDISDEIKDQIKQISKAGEQARRLTSQLLAFSRKQVIHPEVLNINTVVFEMFKMIKRLLGEDIEIVTKLNPELGNVKVDPGQMEQIIINLAVNARDALPKGGQIIIESDNVVFDNEYTRKHIGSREGQFVLLSISDNGIGMDAETISHIFEPFYTTKDREKGTGLGLSTVYGIIRQNDGHIWVESEPGEGSSFKIYLPLVEDEEESETKTKRIQEQLSGNETILLVEDDPGVRNLTEDFLKRLGYHVLKAVDGFDALDVCNRYDKKIHLLLTDVVMPKMNGKELAKLMLAQYPNIKIIYFSGYTEEGIVKHGILESGTEFVQKPFKTNILAKKIRKVLGQKSL